MAREQRWLERLWLLGVGSGGQQDELLGGPTVWVAAQRGAGGECCGQGPAKHPLALSLFPFCASLPVALLHTSFPTYFLVGLSGAFLGNPFYCKMNKILQNNRRLHGWEWACNHNHPATLPPPPGPREVGRERCRGRKTLGQPCWAGRKARCIPWPRAPGTEEQSQSAWEKPPAPQAAPLHAADPLQVPSRLLKNPGGSCCGEARAGARAGTASSALYLQFRWDLLQRKRLDKEAPGPTQPHPNRTVPVGPWHPRLVAPPLSRRQAEEQPSDVPASVPNSHRYRGPEKGSEVPSLPEHLPRERQRVFLPAAAHTHN